MIIVIAVLAIALLISSIGWVNTAIKKKHQDRMMKIREDQVYVYQEKLADIDQSFKKLVTEQEEELGFGQHIKWRNTEKPTSQVYRIIFDIDPNGQKIINDLTNRFKRNVFTTDERETCRRIGRQEVVDFILNRINTANDPRYSEQLEITYMENAND